MVKFFPGWDPTSAPTQLINRLARMLSRAADVRLRDLNLSVGQLPVLVALKDGKCLTQKELAQIANVEQPTMAQILARMMREGLINRDPDPSDGRSSLISLTDVALAQLPKSAQILSGLHKDALRGFDPDEVKMFSDFLKRMISNVMELPKD